MNNRQKFLLVLGLVVVAAMCAYPPWEAPGRGYTYPTGYSFVLNPPTGISHIDFSPLLTQMVVVGATVGAGYLLLGFSGRHRRISRKEMIASNALMAEHFLSTEKLGQWNPLSKAMAKEIIAVLRQVRGGSVLLNNDPPFLGGLAAG